jgi:hypothetical protein
MRRDGLYRTLTSMTFPDLGKLLVIAGLLIAAVGGALIVGRRLGIGRLPGDISVSSNGFSLFFPIVTCVVISVALTVIINVLLRLFR